jgi:predicted TIM-barrel fold metal-dependent hydrolase
MMGDGANVIDGLAFSGESLFGRSQKPEELFAKLDAGSVDGVVLTPHRSPDYLIPPANDVIATIVSEDPRRRRQLGRIDPNHRDALAETRRCIEELEVAGFYLNPREEAFAINGRRAQRVFEVIAESGLPVVVETGVPWCSEPLQVADIASKYPSLPIVMTNGGQLNISGLGQAEAYTALDRCDNLAIQTTGVYRQDFLERCITLYGAHRVMFASLSPHFDLGYEMLRVLGASSSATDRAAVLGGTAKSLFWADATPTPSSEEKSS